MSRKAHEETHKLYFKYTPVWFAILEKMYLFIYSFIYFDWTVAYFDCQFFVYQYKEKTDFYAPAGHESNRWEVMGNEEGKENRQG